MRKAEDEANVIDGVLCPLDCHHQQVTGRMEKVHQKGKGPERHQPAWKSESAFVLQLIERKAASVGIRLNVSNTRRTKVVIFF